MTEPSAMHEISVPFDPITDKTNNREVNIIVGSVLPEKIETIMLHMVCGDHQNTDGMRKSPDIHHVKIFKKT